MLEYYIHEVDENGGSLSLTRSFSAEDDAAAYAKAVNFSTFSQNIIEVWTGLTLIWRLSPLGLLGQLSLEAVSNKP